MKLDFHYFTAKFIAARVGYSEEEAQLIATTCQFVNDNHQPSVLYLQKEQVSEAIKKRGLCQDDPSKGPDACKIPLLLSALADLNNFDALKNKKNQEEILIPFYYFSDSVVEAEEEYRVKPIDTLQSSDTFSLLFKRAQQQYRLNDQDQAANANTAPNAVQALRRLGVLLHIAADSFAYVPFNGYTSDINRWTITEVKDTRNFKTITDQYDPKKYAAYPSVGKFRTSGVSDDYNRQFILSVDKSPVSYTRINNDCFAKAAKAIYRFLCNFRGKEPSEQDWRDNVFPVLLKCWNTDFTSYEDLKKHWSSQTSLNYDYDADAIRQSIVDYDPTLQPVQQGYFDFLLMLQDVKDAVKGKLKGDGNMLTVDAWSADAITCEISEPDFSGDSYKLKISASFPAKLASLGMLVSIMDTDTQELIWSDTHNYKNTSTVDEKITLNIPKTRQNLLAKIDFAWRDTNGSKKKTFKQEYVVIGNAELIVQQQLIEPQSSNERAAIQIVNGTESISADYCYPENAQYTSQEGIAQLDLYTPIDLGIKLADGFNMLDYRQLSVSLTSVDGQVFKYCNNTKFISVKQDRATGILHIKAAEEWKNRFAVNSFHASIAKLKLQISVILEVSSDDETGYRNVVVDTLTNDELVTNLEYLWNLQ